MDLGKVIVPFIPYLLLDFFMGVVFQGVFIWLGWFSVLGFFFKKTPNNPIGQSNSLCIENLVHFAVVFIHSVIPQSMK